MRARFQNVYGPGEILGAGRWRGTPHTVWRNVTPTFVWKALHRQALPVENGGIASRDFIFVEDIARGSDRLRRSAARRARPTISPPASKRRSSISRELINELTGNPTPIALAPARDWDRSGHRFGDPSKAREQLGFSAETALRDGLAETIAWTRANADTIRRCMLQHARFVPGLRAAAGMKPFRMLTVVGARPQFVKAAAISRAVAARDDIEEILLHTGQHFDAAMSRVFFDELGIPAPRINLGIHGGSHGEMTGRMLAGIEEAILAERPDIVLVPGDTNSTLAGALAAAKLHVPVAHLEAGLRSFNRAMPEEINRVADRSSERAAAVPDRNRDRQSAPRGHRRGRP